MEEKECTRCKSKKPLSEFCKVKGPKSGKYGLFSHCRTCQVNSTMAWRKKNMARHRAYQKKWWAKNYKRWYADNKEKTDFWGWRWRIKTQFNCSVEQYEAMFKAQNGVCAICSNKCERGRLSIDHCHKTKKIRALLCRGCNSGIADFKESIDALYGAIKYLKKHS